MSQATLRKPLPTAPLPPTASAPPAPQPIAPPASVVLTKQPEQQPPTPVSLTKQPEQQLPPTYNPSHMSQSTPSMYPQLDMGRPQYPPPQPMGVPPVVVPFGGPNYVSAPAMMMPSSTIVDHVLTPPLGTTFLTAPGGGDLIVRIISAKNLVAADVNGKSDPYVRARSANGIEHFKTKSKSKTLNPTWNDTYTIHMNHVEANMLILEVYDKDAIGKDDLIGYVGIDISLLPYGAEVVTNENLSYVKHGTLQVGLTAVNFGIQGYPPIYPMDYITWRQKIPAVSRKGMEKEKHDIKKQKSVCTKSHKPPGPYHHKFAHPKYELVNGWLKLKKTSGESFKDGMKTTGIILGAVVLGALSA
eukprot:gene11489-13399_t